MAAGKDLTLGRGAATDILLRRRVSGLGFRVVGFIGFRV